MTLIARIARVITVGTRARRAGRDRGAGDPRSPRLSATSSSRCCTAAKRTTCCSARTPARIATFSRQPFRMPVTKGITGAAVTTREVQIVNDVRKDPRYVAAAAADQRAHRARGADRARRRSVRLHQHRRPRIRSTRTTSRASRSSPTTWPWRSRTRGCRVGSASGRGDARAAAAGARSARRRQPGAVVDQPDVAVARLGLAARSGRRRATRASARRAVAARVRRDACAAARAAAATRSAASRARFGVARRRRATSSGWALRPRCSGSQSCSRRRRRAFAWISPPIARSRRRWKKACT